MTGNIFDYMEWRGDLGIDRDPFNDVDSLILSVLAYVPFEGIVGPEARKRGISIADAASALFRTDVTARPVRTPKDLELLSALASSARFGDMRLSGYVSEHDGTEQKQFSAITVETGDGLFFVAYRGTDMTLVGWKENFNMSFLPNVPAQREAVRYLESTAESVRGKLRVGGHSKGGNLAVYASAFCERSVQKRIASIYDHDGPGFTETVLGDERYARIRERVRSLIPQSSVIGMLLENSEEYTVIESAASGIMQHDPYSWRLKGADFSRVEKVSEKSVFIDRTLKDWLSGLEAGRREAFVDALYQILAATNATYFPELTTDWLKTAKALGKSLKSVDEPTKKMLIETLVLLARSAKKNAVRIKDAKMKTRSFSLPGVKKNGARD
jgi:hypothetical protein